MYLFYNKSLKRSYEEMAFESVKIHIRKISIIHFSKRFKLI